MKTNLLALALVSMGSLQGAIINIQLTGFVTGATVTRTIADSATFGLSTAPLTLQAGLLTYGGLLAYCLEPQQSTGPVGGGLIPYTIDPTMLTAPGNVGGMLPVTATRVSDLRRLLNNTPDAFSGSISALQAAAFQIAIWEILRETAGTPYDVLSGNVSYTGESIVGVFAQANAWLSNLSSQTERETAALTNDTFQDLIIPTPEPGTFGMLGAGAVMIVFGIRRRKS